MAPPAPPWAGAGREQALSGRCAGGVLRASSP